MEFKPVTIVTDNNGLHDLLLDGKSIFTDEAKNQILKVSSYEVINDCDTFKSVNIPLKLLFNTIEITEKEEKDATES